MSNLAENVELATSVDIPRHWLIETLKAAMHFASNDKDVRYYLNGVCLHLKHNEVALIATDGHRLFYTDQELYVPDNLKDTQYILRIESLKQIKNMAKLDKQLKKDGKVSCKFEIPSPDSQFARITDFNDQTFQFECIDGKFPDYKRVMWQEELPDIENELATLKSLVRRGNASKGQLEELIQRLPPVSNSVGFNFQYLADLAKLKPLMNEHNVGVMEIKDERSAARIKAKNVINQRDILVYQMPAKK